MVNIRGKIITYTSISFRSAACFQFVTYSTFEIGQRLKQVLANSPCKCSSMNLRSSMNPSVGLTSYNINHDVHPNSVRAALPYADTSSLSWLHLGTVIIKWPSSPIIPNHFHNWRLYPSNFRHHKPAEYLARESQVKEPVPSISGVRFVGPMSQG